MEHQDLASPHPSAALAMVTSLKLDIGRAARALRASWSRAPREQRVGVRALLVAITFSVRGEDHNIVDLARAGGLVAAVVVVVKVDRLVEGEEVVVAAAAVGWTIGVLR